MAIQGELVFTKNQEEVSDAVIAKYPTLKALIKFACEVSGIPFKQISADLNYDEKQFIRCLANNPDDNRHFPADMLEHLMVVLGNDIPLRWLALRRGYGLHRLMSELERENLELKQRLEEKDKEHATILKVIRELKG